MQKSTKMHVETYDTVKQLAKENQRPFITTLDIIVKYYMEGNNAKRKREE